MMGEKPLYRSTAFPKLSQQSLYSVLRTAQVQTGMINLAKGCYAQTIAFSSFGGRPVSFLDWLTSGIMQGCPLSSTIFAIASDPTIASMEGQGLTRACADDIAVLCFNFPVMIHIGCDCATTAKVAHSCHNLAKCLLVPI